MLPSVIVARSGTILNGPPFRLSNSIHFQERKISGFPNSVIARFFLSELDNYYALLELSFNSNTLCYCSSSIDHPWLMNLLYSNIIYAISNLPNLNEVDCDKNMLYVEVK